MENGKTHRGNRDVREYKKPISINEKLLPLNVIEIHCDALSLPSDFALAICITEDFHFFTSNAVDFKHKFGSIGKLMDQNLCVGDVGQIIHNDQYVFYLIVREKYKRTSSANILEKSLINLRIKMETLKLTKLAIPKNGFDCINLRDATILISKIFATSNIEISICLMTSNSDVYRIHPPKINSTTNQLWEMEPQTDLIMFVNMELMYMDDWNDPVINNVDLKYPFKNKLLEDINIKPMAAGDVLSYIIDREILFCVFTNPVDQNQSYFECLEQAFKKIKSQLPGYRFLAIQRESLDNEYTVNDTSRIVLLLQTIFNHLNAEIWICNDTDSNKVDQFKHYNKFVTSSIETSNKGYSKIVFKPKVKPFRKKSNTDHTTNAYGFVKNYSNKNHHDNTEIY